MSLYRGPSVIGTSTDTTFAMVLSATTAAITAANEANNAIAAATASASSAVAADASKVASVGSAATASSAQGATATSAANSATSATNAATSANNAGNSATAAGNSATAAGTSATNASTSAGTASTQASNAVTTFNTFDDRFLGAKATAPTVNNRGGALAVGTNYFDTALLATRSWSGSTWVSLPATTAGAIGNALAGGITETSVQGALNGLDTRKANAGANTDITSLASLTSINGGQLAGQRNRIINGACNIAQRGSFVGSLNIGGYGGPDRFYTSNSGAGGQFTQAASTLTFGGVARNAIRQTVDAATTAFTTTNFWYGFRQAIEGLNSYDLKGRPVAISFIFNSNVTGNYSVALRDSPTSQSYVTSFTATANVPVKVTIPVSTIPLTLSIPATNAVGLEIAIGFQNQATYQTATLNAWQAGNFVSANGATIWAATAGNFIELTELQLEEGSVATPFERQSYGVELALCQRYYEVAIAGALTSAVAGQYCGFPVYWKASKRALPTIVTTTLYNTAGGTPGTFDVKEYGAIVYTTAGGTGAVELRTSLAVSAEL